MLVKTKYNTLSESLMYEWALEEQTPFNRAKRKHYAFFQSIKDLDTTELSLDEVIRLAKIEETQIKQLKPKRYYR